MTTSHAHAPRHWVPEWEFGDRLRKVRTSMGLGQVEFAEHLDLKAPTLAAYETGRANPRSRDLRAVQAMLGHASLATTQRYLHVDHEGLRAAAMGTEMAYPKLRAA